jgi:hypothetical protein
LSSVIVLIPSLYSFMKGQKAHESPAAKSPRYVILWVESVQARVDYKFY